MIVSDETSFVNDFFSSTFGNEVVGLRTRFLIFSCWAAKPVYEQYFLCIFFNKSEEEKE